MILNDVGVVAYNGYQFDGASQVTVRVEPVQDEARRTIIYHRYTVSVQTIIADPDNTDDTMQGIRARLTKQGQSLAIYHKGVGDLLVNMIGGVNDVAFGPTPKLLVWEPIGSLRAAQVTWECEACIAFCASPLVASGIIALNYGVTHELDLRGCTTRTISGYLEIGMTRDGYAIPDTADAYREAMNPYIPTAFQRTSQTFNLSLDKRRLDFSITDTEINSPNPYPLGAVRVDAKHRVQRTRRGGTGGRFRNTLTVEVELAPDQPLLNGWVIFEWLARQRLTIARDAYQGGVIIEDISAEEDIFGRSCSFSMNYTIAGALKSLLTSTGLWTPVGYGTWNQWMFSLQNIQGVRGYAGLRHLPSNDAIIDVCAASSTFPSETEYRPGFYPPLQKNIVKNETPSPDSSWIEYDPYLKVERERPVTRQSVLQCPDAEDTDYDPNAVTGLLYNNQNGYDDIVQFGGGSRYTVTLMGRAQRAGYPIPRPALTMFGGAIATEVGGTFITKIVDNYLGVPVYGAMWKIEYVLNNAPGLVQPLPNVNQGVLADGSTVQPTNV